VVRIGARMSILRDPIWLRAGVSRCGVLQQGAWVIQATRESNRVGERRRGGGGMGKQGKTQWRVEARKATAPHSMVSEPQSLRQRRVRVPGVQCSPAASSSAPSLGLPVGRSPTPEGARAWRLRYETGLTQSAADCPCWWPGDPVCTVDPLWDNGYGHPDHAHTHTHTAPRPYSASEAVNQCASCRPASEAPRTWNTWFR